MTSKPSTSFEEEDDLLVRFCRMVLDSPQTPELINRLAADAGFVRVCRKFFQDGEDRVLQRCCRRKHFDETLIRLRLLPVARALRLTPDSGSRSDYYSVLGVAANADRQTIKEAYRQMAFRLHPDKRPHDGGELFLALQAAYVHLSDPDLRAQYDRKHPTEEWIETRPPIIHPSRMFRLHRSSWSIAVLSVILAAAAYGVDLYVQESSLFKEQALLENNTVPEPDQRIGMESALGVFSLAEADSPADTDEAVLKHRLDTFLEEYCAAYSQEDLEKLSALFLPDATEQGQPVSAMLPRHGQYFKEVTHLNCRIRLVSFARQDRAVALQGEFIESYQTPDGRQSKHFGPIRMELFDTIDRLRIRKLEYGAI